MWIPVFRNKSRVVKEFLIVIRRAALRGEARRPSTAMVTSSSAAAGAYGGRRSLSRCGRAEGHCAGAPRHRRRRRGDRGVSPRIPQFRGRLRRLAAPTRPSSGISISRGTACGSWSGRSPTSCPFPMGAISRRRQGARRPRSPGSRPWTPSVSTPTRRGSSAWPSVLRAHRPHTTSNGGDWIKRPRRQPRRTHRDDAGRQPPAPARTRRAARSRWRRSLVRPAIFSISGSKAIRSRRFWASTELSEPTPVPTPQAPPTCCCTTASARPTAGRASGATRSAAWARSPSDGALHARPAGVDIRTNAAVAEILVAIMAAPLASSPTRAKEN